MGRGRHAAARGARDAPGGWWPCLGLAAHCALLRRGSCPAPVCPDFSGAAEHTGWWEAAGDALKPGASPPQAACPRVPSAGSADGRPPAPTPPPGGCPGGAAVLPPKASHLRPARPFHRVVSPPGSSCARGRRRDTATRRRASPRGGGRGLAAEFSVAGTEWGLRAGSGLGPARRGTPAASGEESAPPPPRAVGATRARPAPTTPAPALPTPGPSPRAETTPGRGCRRAAGGGAASWSSGRGSCSVRRR